jgi:CBS domain-containing protein/gamma-glutamylcysteine synthetase
MGRHDVAELEPPQARAFTKALLRDLQALERMLQDGMIESGIKRIGAEQELFLVDRGWRPNPVSLKVLEDLNPETFTTEITQFNLEINAPPLSLEAGCFSASERRLNQLIEEVRAEARKHDAEVVLTGILPTITRSDLSLDKLTPLDRYRALNETLASEGGGVYRIRIRGTDELNIEHDSLTLEGSNTSFQVHLQVSAEEFARFYNVSQAMIAPVLAAAVNSPLLLGRRLWAETRIALFHQAMDTRRSTPPMRDIAPRVSFGERWVTDSVLEVFQDDVARFPTILGSRIACPDSMEVLNQGGVPELRALQIFNSTVYRWNRPCYGITDGQPHLRIEFRALPAGPSVRDEIANAAFWVGLVLGGAAEYEDVSERMDFSDAKENFVAAARRGLKAGFTWMDGVSVSASELILEELLPMADKGLLHAGIDSVERDLYLGVIEARVRSGRTGANWTARSLAQMGAAGTRAERMAALTATAVAQQIDGRPVHEWELASLGGKSNWLHSYRTVEQCMSTDLFTVKEDAVVDLTAFLMDRKHIRQVPVEDNEHRVVGLVDYGALLRLTVSGRLADPNGPVPVKAIMDPEPLTVTPETSTLDAMKLMRQHGVTTLLVLKNDRLVGILSVDDFMPIAERLLEETYAQGGYT